MLSLLQIVESMLSAPRPPPETRSTPDVGPTHGPQSRTLPTHRMQSCRCLLFLVAIFAAVAGAPLCALLSLQPCETSEASLLEAAGGGLSLLEFRRFSLQKMQLKMVPSRQGGRQERPGAASRRFSLQKVDKKWCPAAKEAAKEAARSAQEPPGATQEPPRSLPNRPPDQDTQPPLFVS